MRWLYSWLYSPDVDLVRFIGVVLGIILAVILNIWL